MTRIESLRVEALNAGLDHLLERADSALGTVEEHERTLKDCEGIIKSLQARPQPPTHSAPEALLLEIEERMHQLSIEPDEGWPALLRALDFGKVANQVHITRMTNPIQPVRPEMDFHGTVEELQAQLPVEPAPSNDFFKNEHENAGKSLS
jgi:hypothetical protein